MIRMLSSVDVLTTSSLSYNPLPRAGLGRRLGPFRVRIEKLGPENMHLAPTPLDVDGGIETSDMNVMEP